MLWNLTKRWYLRCYKYRRRNFDVYPHIRSCESSFLLSANLTIWFYYTPNEQTKYTFFRTDIRSRIYLIIGSLLQLAYGIGT